MKVSIKRVRSGKGLRSLGPIQRQLHRNLKKVWFEATREFLRAIVDSDVIAVDTGMSKSSLIPLARAVKLTTEVRASINPMRGPQKGYTNIQGRYIKGGIKSAALGERLGNRAYTLDFGNPQKPDMKFIFEIRVFQYLLHELGIVQGSGPWNSLQIGLNAFEAYLKEHAINAVPSLGTYLVTGRIK